MDSAWEAFTKRTFSCRFTNLSSRLLPNTDQPFIKPIFDEFISLFGYPIIIFISSFAIIGTMYLIMVKFLRQVSYLIGNNEGSGSNLRLEAQKIVNFDGSPNMWQRWKIEPFGHLMVADMNES